MEHLIIILGIVISLLLIFVKEFLKEIAKHFASKLIQWWGNRNGRPIS